MIFRSCPAAYVREGRRGSAYLAQAYHAVAEQACQHGWPAAELYVDPASAPQPGGPALARLHAAITQDRHAVLLIAVPVLRLRPDQDLIALLSACTRHGVTVAVVLPSLRTPLPAARSPAALVPWQLALARVTGRGEGRRPWWWPRWWWPGEGKPPGDGHRHRPE